MREVSSTQVITAIAITAMRPYGAYGRMSRSSQCTCTRAATIAMHMHADNCVGVRLW